MSEWPDDGDMKPPVVTGCPDEIYLVFGDLDRDDTYENICKEGEVCWASDNPFPSDVPYVLKSTLATHQAVMAQLVGALKDVLPNITPALTRSEAITHGKVLDALAAHAGLVGEEDCEINRRANDGKEQK